MEITVKPGTLVGGETAVPGDKSIAHRWLMLAAAGSGTSALDGLPSSLDVRSTARCLGSLRGAAGEPLIAWAEGSAATGRQIILAGEGWEGLRAPAARGLDCGNSGTTMRILAGILASRPFRSVLTGDASLSTRPMERVAIPLRRMGATIATVSGHAPIVVDGGDLSGVSYEMQTPSAQVKGAILMAGLCAAGTTSVREPAPTRDHTERALAELGAPVRIEADTVTIEAFQHAGFEGTVPGDPSSAAFLVAAAGMTDVSVRVAGVCLNPTRMHFIEIFRRMGMKIELEEHAAVLGEPVGDIVASGSIERGVTVGPEEIPLLIDEVPVLALAASLAPGPSAFHGIAELRLKESDRVTAISEGLLALGGEASAVGETLVVDGGGLAGGRVDPNGDHRMAMAFAVAALGARSESRISGIECAEVSFPGFVGTLRSLGAEVG